MTNILSSYFESKKYRRQNRAHNERNACADENSFASQQIPDRHIEQAGAGEGDQACGYTSVRQEITRYAKMAEDRSGVDKNL